jgi:hypothetical protein
MHPLSKTFLVADADAKEIPPTVNHESLKTLSGGPFTYYVTSRGGGGRGLHLCMTNCDEGGGEVFKVGRHKALHKRHQMGYVGNFLNFF